MFIKKPGDTPSNSAAKFNEYGDNTEPLFLKSLNSNLIQKDGSFRVDVQGGNMATTMRSSRPCSSAVAASCTSRA